MKRFFLYITLALCVPLFALAGQIPIAVKAFPGANSTIGRKLVQQVKNNINGQSLLQVVSPDTPYALEINIISVNFKDKPMSVYAITWSVNWPRNPYFTKEYLLSDVGYVGALQVSSAAEDILARTMKLLSAYQSTLQRMQAYRSR